eukprot:2973093-Rhodomonas_salina.3
MVLVPTGLSIRAGPHVRKPRIGSLHFRQVVPVLSVHAAWLRSALSPLRSCARRESSGAVDTDSRRGGQDRKPLGAGGVF